MKGLSHLEYMGFKTYLERTLFSTKKPGSVKFKDSLSLRIEILVLKLLTDK